MSLYFLGPHARSDEQMAEMTALETAGICIFCPSSYTRNLEPEALLAYDGGVSKKKLVLLANGTWAVLRNQYPYPGTKRHFLLAPQRHVTDLHELKPVEWTGFHRLLKTTIRHFGIEDHYALGLRSGNMRFTGATIAHLHYHLVVAEEQPEVKVRFRMSGNPPQ